MKNIFETFLWRCNKCHVWGAGCEGKDFECLPECDGEIVKVSYAEFWDMSEREQAGIEMYRDEIKRLKAAMTPTKIECDGDKPAVITRFLDGSIDFAVEDD